MTGIDALVPTKTRAAGEAHGASAGHKADPDTAAAFHSVMRDIGRRGDDRQAGDATAEDATANGTNAGEIDGEAKTSADKTDDAGKADDVAAMAEVQMPSGEEAARILAELTGTRTAPETPGEKAGTEDKGGKGAAKTAGADEMPADKPVSLKATVVARETHFEPVRRPEALDRMRVEPRADADSTAPASDTAAANGKSRSALADALASASPQAAAQAAAGQTSAQAAAAAQFGTATAPRPGTEPGREPASKPADDAGIDAGAEGSAAVASRTEAPLATQAAGDKDTRGNADRNDVRDTAAVAADETAETLTATAAGSDAALPTQTLQRLAGSIVSEARAMASAAAAAASDGAPQQASGGPVKILTIRLQPEHLGTVTVRMRLVGNALEMQFRVSNAETAELLKRDRDSLADILKSSGYDADLLTIQASGDGLRAVVSTDASSGSGSASQRQDLPQQQDAFRQGAGNPDGRQDNGGRDGKNENAGRRSAERQNETVADGSRSGDLYV